MSKYTIELIELIRDGVEIFDFDYDFYIEDEEIKKNWEQKFIDYYMFNEIGFSTVYKFKHYLREKLNRIAPYYQQIYQTEVRCKDIDFMLNKDLKETFLREIDNIKDNDISKQTVQNNNLTADYEGSSDRTNEEIREESMENTSNRSATDNGENTTNMSVETTNATTEDIKQSSIPNGNASLGLEDAYLTHVAKNEVNTEGTETSELTGTSQNTLSEELTNTSQNDASTSITEGVELTSKENRVEKSDEDTKINQAETSNMIESTELISKGNIGTTSSAELLEKWRKVLINIDELIIEECRDLFMYIY